MMSPATPLHLSDVFHPEDILLGLRQRTQAGVIKELVRHLTARGLVDPFMEPWVVRMIATREQAEATALRNGVAVPHATGCTDQLVGALAIDPDGVDFCPPGLAPVHVIFLVLIPVGGLDRFRDLLRKISTASRDKDFLLRLREAKTAEDAHLLLSGLDREEASDGGGGKTFSGPTRGVA
jgi:nitrogen PTS system EIIA component